VPTTVPFRARAANGSYVELEAVSKPYTEADGAPRLIVSVRDVRERRRLEGELLAARRLESVGRLAGGVAHDFNNLLTAVVGNLSLIRSHEGTAPVGEHLDEIEHAVQRGAELTRRLLAFARRQMIEPRIVALHPQITELERLLRRLIGENVRLELDVPEDLWTVRVDPLALEQMLVNLVVNARDAMTSGGVVAIAGANVSIGEESPLHFGVPSGDWVQLDVRDTGAGIEDAVLGQIFEPFFTTKGESGTGLGLATVYGAVRQAGGQIRVHSEVRVGTTFSLFFPRVIESATRPIEGTRPPQLSRARPGETILLIEDEVSVRDVTGKLLTKLGYEVITANDGLDGVAKAAEYGGNLSLVLSDLMMPELGGVEAVNRIHERRPGIPVVFISGYSEKALDWGEAMPAWGRLLSKPFSVDDLSGAIRSAIDHAAAASSV
jgi:signal transduction histidine kinase/ActR/RegA family two-component response regulator